MKKRAWQAQSARTLTPEHLVLGPCSNVPVVPPLIQRNYDSYDWAGPRAWACYRPDADVLLPMYYTFTAEELVAPLAAPRPITALLRFAYRKGDGKNLVEHYGHRLRHELLAAWRHDPLEGSSIGMASKEVNRCLRESTFTSKAVRPLACRQLSVWPFRCTLRRQARSKAESHAGHSLTPLEQAPAIKLRSKRTAARMSDVARNAAANGCGYGGGHVLRVPAGCHAGQHAHVARAAQGLHPGHVLPRQQPALRAAPGRQLLGLHGQSAAGRRPAHAGAPPAPRCTHASYAEACEQAFCRASGVHLGL